MRKELYIQYFHERQVLLGLVSGLLFFTALCIYGVGISQKNVRVKQIASAIAFIQVSCSAILSSGILRREMESVQRQHDILEQVVDDQLYIGALQGQHSLLAVDHNSDTPN